MITNAFLWLIKSIVILGIFQFVIPTIVNAMTGNRWVKFPVMLVFAVLAGVFMAWLNYVPFLLFFLWLALNKHTLRVMTEEKFESDYGMKINKPLFYISSYSYVILACLLAWFFQAELVTTGDPTGKGILLWKYFLWFELTKVGPIVEVISWVSVLFYCLFGTFVNYQLLHMRDFRGASQTFFLLLSISAFAGTITGFVYLVYYGWTVVWWIPIIIFIIGNLFSFVNVFIEQLVGKFTLSLLGFFGWPLCAFFMFHYIPKVP